MPLGQACVTGRKDGRNALHWAARNGHRAVCEWLMQPLASAATAGGLEPTLEPTPELEPGGMSMPEGDTCPKTLKCDCVSTCTAGGAPLPPPAPLVGIDPDAATTDGTIRDKSDCHCRKKRLLNMIGNLV